MSEPAIRDVKVGLQRHIFGCLKRSELCWNELLRLICDTPDNYCTWNKLVR